MKGLKCVVGVMLFCLTILVGCRIQPTVSMRSGTVHDDDVEEPLASRAEKYEPALRTSNDILDNLIARNHQVVWETRIAPSLQEEVSQPAFQSMMEQTESNLGTIKSYKPMQWAFDRDGRYLVSTKIVQYENGAMNFRFVFPRDGPFDRILGLQTQPRNSRKPGK